LEALVDLPQVGSNDIHMRAHLGCDSGGAAVFAAPRRVSRECWTVSRL